MGIESSTIFDNLQEGVVQRVKSGYKSTRIVGEKAMMRVLGRVASGCGSEAECVNLY